MRPIVREFCRQRGISYQEAGLYEALASVGNHLGDMTAAYNASVAQPPVRDDAA
jgi:hypothetical protein